MGLVIKDKALEEAVTELASLTGGSWEAALLRAARDMIEQEQKRQDAERRFEALMDLGRRFSALPDRNPRFAQEDLYDENGLPA